MPRKGKAPPPPLEDPPRLAWWTWATAKGEAEVDAALLVGSC